jgi:hypothetical protein
VLNCFGALMLVLVLVLVLPGAGADAGCWLTGAGSCCWCFGAGVLLADAGSADAGALIAGNTVTEMLVLRAEVLLLMIRYWYSTVLMLVTQ